MKRSHTGNNKAHSSYWPVNTWHVHQVLYGFTKLFSIFPNKKQVKHWNNFLHILTFANFQHRKLTLHVDTRALMRDVFPQVLLYNMNSTARWGLCTSERNLQQFLQKEASSDQPNQHLSTDFVLLAGMYCCKRPQAPSSPKFRKLSCLEYQGSEVKNCHIIILLKTLIWWTFKKQDIERHWSYVQNLQFFQDKPSEPRDSKHCPDPHACVLLSNPLQTFGQTKVCNLYIMPQPRWKFHRFHVLCSFAPGCMGCEQWVWFVWSSFYSIIFWWRVRAEV